MANIHRAIGMGSDQMLDQLLPADRDKDADTGLRMSHDALYATYWTRLRPLPGAVELLRACKARGLAVVLASSAGEAESGVLRAALDAEDAIDDAAFSGEVERTKPAPDLVQVALEKAAVPAGQAVFVGDTVWDVQASQKAGVPCIGLLSGGIGRQELADAAAAQIYAAPAGCSPPCQAARSAGGLGAPISRGYPPPRQRGGPPTTPPGTAPSPYHQWAGECAQRSRAETVMRVRRGRSWLTAASRQPGTAGGPGVCARRHARGPVG